MSEFQIPIIIDTSIPNGMVLGVTGRGAKDWGFDEIYPAPPRRLTPWEQVEQWDRERRRAGLKPWIEPRSSGLAGLSSILKETYTQSMLHQLNANHSLFWSSREITTGTKMLEDMQRYSAAAPHRRALTAIKNFRSSWRRQLALRLAPELQEDYSW